MPATGMPAANQSRAGIGHNGGPQPASGWHLHCWRQARADLLPHLPIEVIRGRVRRAQDLGLDYKTYAGVRATTGRDIVAFLYSSNALRVFPRAPQLPEAMQAHLARSLAEHRGLAVAPLTAVALDRAAQGALAQCHPAPPAFASFARMRAAMDAARHGLPRDAVILVAEPHERDWCAAGGLAWWLTPERLVPSLS